MNMQERYEDISKRSGISEEVVKRVIRAINESMVNSLAVGEKAMIPGICTCSPVFTVKDVVVKGVIEGQKYVDGFEKRLVASVKIKPSSKMVKDLNELASNNEITSKRNENVKEQEERLRYVATEQISALL